jgi:osmoprotectant transport system ATP-binding protein
MIVARNLTKTFNHTTAVNDVSFEVNKGEMLVLLGTSGCGKTTTLKMINRLIVPDAGNVWIEGEEIQRQNAGSLRRKIGYVLQNNGLFPHYTVAENIAVVPELLGWDKTKTRNRIAELLEKLYLPPATYASLYPHELSGGQQQRVGLARALAAKPPVLLMDEPFGALDPITKASTKKDLTELDEFKDKTIIMVTHDMAEAFEMGDEICLMDKGKIVQKGAPHDLLFRPVNDFVRSFLNGQQLSLELKTTRLEQLWPFLKNNTALQPHNVLLSTQTLWQAIEAITASGTEYIFISRENETKQAGYQELMMAFVAYKKN